MSIIRFADIKQTPWKNGGGITREIAIARVGEALMWRLSMADVDADGPFSKFDGLQRILTVIEGQGMELIAPHKTLHADLAVPVHFDGAWAIQSKLKNGPLRDLNLIYDPTFCDGEVVVLKSGIHTLENGPKQIHALHCLGGEIKIDERTSLEKGDTLLLEKGAVHFSVRKHQALLITISFKS